MQKASLLGIRDGVPSRRSSSRSDAPCLTAATAQWGKARNRHLNDERQDEVMEMEGQVSVGW